MIAIVTVIEATTAKRTVRLTVTEVEIAIANTTAIKAIRTWSVSVTKRRARLIWKWSLLERRRKRRKRKRSRASEAIGKRRRRRKKRRSARNTSR